MTADKQSYEAAELFDLLGSLAAVIASSGGPYQDRALALSRLCKTASTAITREGKSLTDVLLDMRRANLGVLVDPDAAPTLAERPSAKRKE